MLSVVIPVYNTTVPEFRLAIRSLQHMNIVDEIILVDDKSTSWETQCELQRQSELGNKVLVNNHKGVTTARATGIFFAKGSHILSMDSDDEIAITSDWREDELALVNIATQNSPWKMPKDVWEYIDDPGPIQWGLILRSDLYRYLVRDISNRQEDLLLGYRLWITMWRDKIEYKYPSGIAYTWRNEVGRETLTSRFPVKLLDHRKLLKKGIDVAIDHTGLCDSDAEAIRLWRGRKNRKVPFVESRYKEGARIDVHVISYSRKVAWLQDTLSSLKDEPVNIHILVGGYPGSIGKARSHGFRLGNAEYVSFLDDDDITIPGMFQWLTRILDEDPAAVGVYTDLCHKHSNGNLNREKKGPWNPLRQLMYSPEITHLKLMRREHVTPFIKEMNKWPTYEEYVLTGLMVKYGDWIHLPEVGCHKRFTPINTSSSRLTQPGLWKRAVRRVAPTLHKAMTRTGVIGNDRPFNNRVVRTQLSS